MPLGVKGKKAGPLAEVEEEEEQASWLLFLPQFKLKCQKLGEGIREAVDKARCSRMCAPPPQDPGSAPSPRWQASASASGLQQGELW